MRLRGKIVVFGLLFTAVPGCDPAGEADQPRAAPRIDVVPGELGLNEPTYNGAVPTGYVTTFALEPVDDAPERRNLLIDASGDRMFFPLAREGRNFPDTAALVRLLSDSLGATPLDPSGQTQGGTAWVGTYSQLGKSFFYDPGTGIAHEVMDPVLAYLGGRDGMLQIGDDSLCIDPDGDCSGELPSYLQPHGMQTAPNHLERCGPPFSTGERVCVMHHSFYNATWWFGDYRRHGTNIRFTTFSALPSTVLTVIPDLRGPIFPFSFFTSNPIGRGVDALEQAFYCYGNCGPDVVSATAVCGTTTITDPDINSSEPTGNGPENAFRCPG